MNNNQLLNEKTVVNEVEKIIVGVSTIYSTFRLNDWVNDSGDWED